MNVALMVLTMWGM